VDLVNEEQCALPHAASLARGFERLFEIGNTGKHRRQLLKMQLERGREQPRDGRLARARRTPENNRMRPVRRNHPPDWTFRPDQMILAHHLDKRLRPQPVGKRTWCVGFKSSGFEQIGHARA
jgi:hypothetical protein